MDVAQIIDELGGTGHVAEACGITPPAVSNWKVRGSIPAEYWQALVGAAETRNISSITYELLGRLHAKDNSAPHSQSVQA